MMTPEPVPQRQLGKAQKLSELSRRQVGLVNEINPPRPQPKNSQRVIRQGGSKASKILKGQR